MYSRLITRRSQKVVRSKELEPGQAVWSYMEPNGRVNSGYATIIAVSPFQVTIRSAGSQRDVVIDARGAEFAVEMSAAEYLEKYGAAAEELMAAIRTKIPAADVGTKVMDNRWAIPDPYEMAATCKEQGLRILGHSDEMGTKRSWGGEDLDIVFCAQHIDTDEKIWCHASSRDIEAMETSIRRWNKKLESETARGDVQTEAV